MINEYNSDILIQLYKQVGNDNGFSRNLVNDNIYVECGEQMMTPFEKNNNNEYKLYSAITIRDIYLDKHLQKKGFFTNFIEYLLSFENIEAVELHFIQPSWLKERLKKSNDWHKQGKLENYVRFKKQKGEENEKFSLF